MTAADLHRRLSLLQRDRDDVQALIVGACRDAGIGAVVLIGSLGHGGGDSFSDLDLIAVRDSSGDHLDLSAVMDGRVLATLYKPRNAPAGGRYIGLCVAVSGLPLWVDLYEWPAATAAIPTDGTVVYDRLGLPASDLPFIPMIDLHRGTDVPPQAAGNIDLLLRVAVAAKYFARADMTRLRRQLPAAGERDPREIGDFLRGLVNSVADQGLAEAVTATSALVSLAEDHYWALGDLASEN